VIHHPVQWPYSFNRQVVLCL